MTAMPTQNRRRFLTAAALVPMALTLTPAAWAAPTEIAGSTTVQKAIIEPTSSAAKGATGVEVKMLPVGTGKGMQMLIEGRVPVAAVSDTLADSVAAAKKAGVAQIPGNLKLHTIVSEKLVPIVHPDNPVKALTREQLRDIFSGKVQNWKEVGGADSPILVVVAAPGSATRGVIEKQILGGGAFGAGAKELRTTAAEFAEVARDKGAIGYVGDGAASSAGGRVKEIGGPEVSRPLGFVTVGDPSPEVAKLIAYWQTPEAQKLFAK